MLSTGDLSWDYSLRTVDANVNARRLLVALEAVAILCLAANMIVKAADIVDAAREFRAAAYLLSPSNWLDWVGFIFQLLAWNNWLRFQAGVAGLRLENAGNFLVLANPHTRIRPFSTNATEELRFLQFVDAVRELADVQVRAPSELTLESRSHTGTSARAREYMRLRALYFTCVPF